MRQRTLTSTSRLSPREFRHGAEQGACRETFIFTMLT